MVGKFFHYRFLGPILLILILTYSIVEMMGYGVLQAEFLPGKTSSAHHQLESACEACHTPLEGVKQETCLECHEQELKAVSDSHAVKIFNDPRAVVFLEHIDAKKCLTCHAEHIAEQTQGRVASAPADFCFPCHEDVAEQRPSHQNLSADGCAASGCHNYHDNEALYEDFIAKHLDEPDLLTQARMPVSNIATLYKQLKPTIRPLNAADQNGGNHNAEQAIVDDWAASAHARSGINCLDCHQVSTTEQAELQWTDYPNIKICEECHQMETQGFFSGKHGTRLKNGLPAMTPELARLPMKPDASEKKLNCNSCHQPHRRDVKKAAVEACLECHIDQHSKAYLQTSHYRLWQAELSGEAEAGSGVSCATCHLPRLVHENPDGSRVEVMHNQNHNLHPNSKMIRSVCMHCHGYEFSVNALADKVLLLNNYASAPKVKVESMDMVKKRLQEEK